jgi:hypothetical protein
MPLPSINQSKLAHYLYGVYQQRKAGAVRLPTNVIAHWRSIDLDEPPEGLCLLANELRDKPARTVMLFEELMRDLGRHVTPGVRLSPLQPDARGAKRVYAVHQVRVRLDEFYGRTAAIILSDVYTLYDQLQADVIASGTGGWEAGLPFLTVERDGQDLVCSAWLCAWPPRAVDRPTDVPEVPGSNPSGLPRVEEPTPTLQPPPGPGGRVVIKYLCVTDELDGPAYLGFEDGRWVTTEDWARAVVFYGGPGEPAADRGYRVESMLARYPEPPCLRGERWVGVIVSAEEGWEARRHKDVWAVVWTSHRTGERRFMTLRNTLGHRHVGDTHDPLGATRMAHAEAQKIYATIPAPPSRAGVPIGVSGKPEGWDVDLVDIETIPFRL